MLSAPGLPPLHGMKTTSGCFFVKVPLMRRKELVFWISHLASGILWLVMEWAIWWRLIASQVLITFAMWQLGHPGGPTSPTPDLCLPFRLETFCLAMSFPKHESQEPDRAFRATIRITTAGQVNPIFAGVFTIEREELRHLPLQKPTAFVVVQPGVWSARGEPDPEDADPQGPAPSPDGFDGWCPGPTSSSDWTTKKSKRGNRGYGSCHKRAVFVNCLRLLILALHLPGALCATKVRGYRSWQPPAIKPSDFLPLPVLGFRKTDLEYEVVRPTTPTCEVLNIANFGATPILEAFTTAFSPLTADSFSRIASGFADLPPEFLLRVTLPNPGVAAPFAALSGYWGCFVRSLTVIPPIFGSYPFCQPSSAICAVPLTAPAVLPLCGGPMPAIACHGILGNCRPISGGVITRDNAKAILDSLIGSTPSFLGVSIVAEFHRRPLPQLYVEALAPSPDVRLHTIVVDQGTYRSMSDFSCSSVKVLADSDSLRTHVPILNLDDGVCKLSGWLGSPQVRKSFPTGSHLRIAMQPFVESSLERLLDWMAFPLSYVTVVQRLQHDFLTPRCWS